MTADVGDPAGNRDEDAVANAVASSNAAASEETQQALSANDSSPEDGAGETVTEVLARLADETAALGRRMGELARLGEHREELLDRLHAENQRLRAGEIAQVQAPLLREIIRSYDLVVSLAGNDSTARSDLELVGHRLLDALEQAGVRPLGPEPGSPFDASRHAAVQRIDTAVPDLDMTVAHSVRAGFVQDGDRVLRPADVAVHRYRADYVTPAPAVGYASPAPAPGLAPITESED
jgi:molecular chaperone GrpE (heat shock protein)